MSLTYPDKLTIQPLSRPPHATVRVPGSKSITNRAMILAALAASELPCTLHGVLDSEDTQVMMQALQSLGFTLEVLSLTEGSVRVSKPTSTALIPATQADLFLANSGTSVRFLTAMVGLGHGRYRLDGIERMRERPIHDLLETLRALGVEAHSEHGTGCPPVVVDATGLRGGKARIRGDVSSQYLSAILMTAPMADEDIELELVGELVSEPYVEMTLAMIRDFGGRIEQPDVRHFHISGQQRYALAEYRIEPDASAASYFLGAAAITGGTVRFEGLQWPSLQGDFRFAEVLKEMGCTVEQGESWLEVRGGTLRGIDIDMNDISDTVMTLAAIACFAEGSTTIRNVAHVRHKETDRLAALTAELNRLGMEVEEREDGLTIHPRSVRPAEIETYNDHRMAMSMALVGLREAGVVIKNPGCVAKTYPEFFSDLDRLR